MKNIIKNDYKEGVSFHACVPFGNYKPYKVHIMYVLSSSYDNYYLVIYKVYSKYKGGWHEFMCTNIEMDMYIKFYNEEKQK